MVVLLVNIGYNVKAMSKEKEEGKGDKKTHNIGQCLRGEVLLSGFIKKALHAKSEGQSNDYDALIQKLATSSDKSLYMRKYLFALKNSISSLTKEFDTLVGTVLSLSWSDKDKETVDEFVDFITNLVSSQTYYLHACLRMLVKHFLPFVPKESSLEAIDLSEQQKRFQNTHEALQAIVDIVPTAPPYLLSVIKQNFPYMMKPLIYQECYTKNLLELAEYVPSLLKDILEIICIHFLKIDVEIPKHELEDVQEEKTQFDVDMEAKEDDEIIKELGEENVEEDENDNMENEMAEKLDVLLTILFDYVKKMCFIDEIYNVDAASDLFDKLIEVFEKVIFPTHNSCHVQFLMFYTCSFDQVFVSTFLEHCWTKFQDPNTPTILRQAAAAYIGSIVARAKYIPTRVVITSLELLVNWIHSYIDEFDGTCGKTDINKHGHFYSLCQAALYIFIFCHSKLLEEVDGINFVRRLNFERIVTSRLNPLKVCLPPVVKIFAAVTRKNEVVFCYTIIEKNNRSLLPVASSTITSVAVAKLSLLNQLDSFFPFDPYLLKRSRKFISVLYRDWKGCDPEGDKENSEDEGEDYMELGKTPEIVVSIPSSFNDVCVSPGF